MRIHCLIYGAAIGYVDNRVTMQILNFVFKVFQSYPEGHFFEELGDCEFCTHLRDKRMEGHEGIEHASAAHVQKNCSSRM